MREVVFVRRKYIQCLANNRLAFRKSKPFERLKGIACRTSSLEDLVDRAAWMFEDDIAGGGRDRANLVGHSEQSSLRLCSFEGKGKPLFVAMQGVVYKAFNDVPVL